MLMIYLLDICISVSYSVKLGNNAKIIKVDN